MTTYARKVKQMEHVGVREFRDKATYYLKLGKPLAIERHGEVIGYYLPVRRKDPEEIKRRLEAFERALEQILKGAELTEEEFAELAERAPKAPAA
jgi:hypothetical protein